MGQLNLIRLFDFYLGAMFLLGTLRRLEQYHSVGRILVAAPGRWPNLMRVMRQHRAVFFTWSTVRPALLALALSVLHMVATRLIWPTANVTIHQLIERWYLLPVLLMALLPMLGLDVFFLVRVSRIDRAETVDYLDKAEYWLVSWRAPVVRFMTFGYVDPRRMVSVEVQKALTEISGLVNSSLYWMSLQIGLRVLFGLTLWGSWVVDLLAT